MADPIFQDVASAEEVQSEAQVTMTTPEGKLVTVPKSQVATARGAGYGYATGEDVAAKSIARDMEEVGNDPLVQAGAFGSGVVRSTLPVLGDAAIAGMATLGPGDVSFNEARVGLGELTNRNQTANLAGELIGAVNPYNPIGAVTNAGTKLAAGKSLLTRFGVGAGFGAAEGALYGSGEGFRRAFTDSAPLTYERVASEMGTGALWGALYGAGFGGAAPVAGDALQFGAKKATGLVGDEALTAFRRERTGKALGMNQSDFRRMSKEMALDGNAGQRWEHLTDLVADYKFRSGPNQGENLMQAFTKADDMVEGVAQMRREIGEELGNIKRQVAPTPVAARDVWSSLRNDVLEPMMRSSDKSQQRMAKRLINEDFAPLRDLAKRDTTSPLFASKRPTFAELDDVRNALAKKIWPDRAPGAGVTVQKEGTEHLFQAYKRVGEEMDRVADAAVPTAGYKKLSQQYSLVKDADDVLQKNVNREIGNRFISPSDYATGIGTGLGALMTGNVAALALGPAAAIGHKLVRERGSSTLAVLADAMLKRNGRIDKAAKLLAGVEKRVRGMPRKAGTAASIFGPEPDAEPEAAEVQAAPVKRAPRVSPEDAKETIERVRRLDQMSPEGKLDVLAESPVLANITAQHPQLGQGLMQQALKMQGILAAKLPKARSRKSYSLQPEAEPVHMTPVEQLRFARFARGVEDPQSVIDDLADGHLDREALQGMQAAHPHDFADVRNRVAEEVAANGNRLPPSRRRLLGMAFDLESDSALVPETMIAAQDRWEEEEPGPQRRQSSGPNPQRLAGNMESKTTSLSREVGA